MVTVYKFHNNPIAKFITFKIIVKNAIKDTSLGMAFAFQLTHYALTMKKLQGYAKAVSKDMQYQV